jgi:O-antigen/teichoic acid export membrane protein
MKINIIKSLIWKLLEKSSTQGIQFLVQIVLARLLFPEQYGVIAIVIVFINLANIFVQSGFNYALVQKKEADDIDFSSILYLSIFIALVLYIVLFFLSPIIASFFIMPELVSIFRVLAFTLFFGAFNSVQVAYVTRYLLFKRLFFSSLGSVIISGTIGIFMAYQGYGVWALVVQQLTYIGVISIILWFTVKWRPHLVFSITRVKVLFRYGWKFLASVLLDTLYLDLRTIVIGRIYSPSMLGYFNRGRQFPDLFIKNINGSIQSVMLPTLSKEQDNKLRVKQMLRRSIVTSTLLIFPMMVGLALVAESLVLIVLTDKWLMAVPFLQIFAIYYALMPIHTANLQAINALGRSDIFLKLEIVKKVIGLLIIIVSIPFGIYVFAWGAVLSGFISSFINAYPNKNLLNYSYLEQIKDILPMLLLSLVMGVLVYSISYLKLNMYIEIVVQIGLGVIVYVLLALLFKMESLKYLIDTLIDFKKQNIRKNIN